MSLPLPLSTEARAQLRKLFARVECEARQIEAAADALPKRLLRAAAWKRGAERREAMAAIVAALALRPFLCTDRAAGFRYLAASRVATGEATSAAETQPAIMVRAIFINSGGRPGLRRETFWTCFTRHALGRLLDRSGLVVDPTAAMLAADDVMTRLVLAEGAGVFLMPEILLPTLAGMFIATPRRAGRERLPLAIARSWIGMDQAHDDQLVRVAAVQAAPAL
jgi:hypothetical protein